MQGTKKEDIFKSAEELSLLEEIKPHHLKVIQGQIQEPLEKTREVLKLLEMNVDLLKQALLDLGDGAIIYNMNRKELIETLDEVSALKLQTEDYLSSPSSVRGLDVYHEEADKAEAAEPPGVVKENTSSKGITSNSGISIVTGPEIFMTDYEFDPPRIYPLTKFNRDTGSFFLQYFISFRALGISRMDIQSAIRYSYHSQSAVLFTNKEMGILEEFRKLYSSYQITPGRIVFYGKRYVSDEETPLLILIKEEGKLAYYSDVPPDQPRILKSDAELFESPGEPIYFMRRNPGDNGYKWQPVDTIGSSYLDQYGDFFLNVFTNLQNDIGVSRVIVKQDTFVFGYYRRVKVQMAEMSKIKNRMKTVVKDFQKYHLTQGVLEIYLTPDSVNTVRLPDIILEKDPNVMTLTFH